MKLLIKSLLSWMLICHLLGHQVVAETLIAQSDVEKLVRNTIHELQQTYLYPDKAEQATKALQKHLSLAKFNQDYQFGHLKLELENMLALATGDSNFEFFEGASTLNTQPALAQPNARQNNRLNSEMIDSHKAKQSIGYLAFHGDFHFYGHTGNAPASSTQMDNIRQAFDDLASADALIMDLRDTGEGSLEIAEFIMSYFLAPGTLLGELHFNSKKAPQALYLKNQALKESPNPAAERRNEKNKPVYILHSSFVSGHWEFLSYTLKQYKKAVVIGEESMGLAKISKQVRVLENIYLNMSYAIIKHPVSEDSWQGYGVAPDYPVDAEDSLDFAIELINAKVKRTE